MLILLPPSETKAEGGRGGPLRLDALSWPELTGIRQTLIDDLSAVSADHDVARRALGLGRTQTDEIARNTRLWHSPTLPAIQRYTGVLFDAFGFASLTRAQRTKAMDRVAIGSALFGAVRAGDPIPAYRMAADARLPGSGTVAARWRPTLGETLAASDSGVVVDLRSGSYQQLGRVAGAITADVVTERPDGSRAVVSHFNKHHKGIAARALVTTRRSPRDIAGVVSVLSDGGQRVEVAGDYRLVIITD